MAIRCAPVSNTPAHGTNAPEVDMSQHRHHGADRLVAGELPRAQTAMNITPMIDVLLVLLVIFMVTLPLNQRGLDVTLPEKAGDGTAPPPHHIVLEYTSDKRLSINRHEVALPDLAQRLRDVFEDRTDKTMFVMAAGSLRYGDIVQVIDAARGAGVTRVGIVTERMRRQ
jgi:biopolymer transport protein ExbD